MVKAFIDKYSNLPTARMRYYYRHPELRDKWRTRKTECRTQTRLKIIEILGGKCVRCGETDMRCLQVDHVNGGGNKERRNTGNNNSKLYRRMLEHPEDYQLLCANCNWKKRYENNERYN